MPSLSYPVNLPSAEKFSQRFLQAVQPIRKEKRAISLEVWSQTFLTKEFQEAAKSLCQKYHCSGSEVHAFCAWASQEVILEIESCESCFHNIKEWKVWFSQWYERNWRLWLTVQVQRKNEEAISALYRYFFGDVLATFRRLVRKNDGPQELADDLFQDAFLIVIRKIQSKQYEIRAGSSLAAYFLGVAKNLLIGAQRRSEYRLKVQYEPQETISQSTASVEDNFLTEERNRRIRDHIQNLGKVCQEILVRFFFQEKSHQKIADELGKTPKSIRNQQYRCMKKLREACTPLFQNS